jgi:hypothetical protein
MLLADRLSSKPSAERPIAEERCSKADVQQTTRVVTGLIGIASASIDLEMKS